MVTRDCFSALLLLLGVACSSPGNPSTRTVAHFTADGSALVFSVPQGENCFLYQTNILTHTTHRLTQATNGCESDPAFSSDGQYFAFIKAPRAGAQGALIFANSNGTGIRTLVSDSFDNLRPVFVPHSNRILFLRSGAFENYSPIVSARRHKFDILSVDYTNGNIDTLTRQQFYDVNNISVSADGRQLLMSLTTYPQGDHFSVINLDQRSLPMVDLQPRVLNSYTPTPVVENAIWLPDGQHLLFSAATGTGTFDYNVYRLTLTSGNIEQLTHLKGMLEGFTVSQDGTKAILLYDEAYFLLELRTRQLTKLSF